MSSISSNGYRLIFVGKKHHLADVRGYAYEHRLEAEKKIGRRLLKGEQVHHINENKLDNTHSNLEVVKSMKHHRFLHRKRNNNLQIPDEKNITIECKCGCGMTFDKYDQTGRPRIYVAGHNPANNFTHRYIINQIKLGNNTTAGLLKEYPYGKSVKTVLTKMVKCKMIIRESLGKYKLPE